MERFTVAVATFGEKRWLKLARRAAKSAEEQAEVICVHGVDLAKARNTALKQVETEFIVYLDADDKLEPGYIKAMEKGKADLRVPMVRYVYGKRARTPIWPRVVGHVHEECEPECLREGNYMVIGTAVRTELLRKVGGWKDYSWSEDWDAFSRCWLAGGTVERIPEAIYRANVIPRSRNTGPSQKQRQEWHNRISAANFG